jgi:hypothetical protein
MPMAKRQTEEQVIASLTRWKSKLKRSITMIDKLERQLKRMQRTAPAKPKGELTIIEWGVSGVREIAEPPKVEKAEIDTSIPPFLQRNKVDPVADQIRQEQADLKKKKAAGRIAKMKAKQSGETRKMPLTGKAALAAIRGE